ncbi:MAG: hypothetical protein AAF558_00915 [Verrucomicrobiota bacterium]
MMSVNTRVQSILPLALIVVLFSLENNLLLAAEEVETSSTVAFSPRVPPSMIQPGGGYLVFAEYTVSQASRAILSYLEEDDSSKQELVLARSSELAPGAGNVEFITSVPKDLSQGKGVWKVSVVEELSGNVSASAKSRVIVSNPLTWQKLLTESFENEGNQWNIAPTYLNWNQPSYVDHKGNRMVQIVRGVGGAEITALSFQDFLDISRYDQIELTFDYLPLQHEEGDRWAVDVNDGSGWRMIKTYEAGKDYQTGKTNGVEHVTLAITPDEIDFNEAFSFRFHNKSSLFQDGLLIDNVSVQGSRSPEFLPQGFGHNAIGGRGGRVIKVTNLNDRGPGSFRNACEASGPRTIIFETAGVITLETPLVVTKPYLTIAGQTAPGSGITLTNGQKNTRPTLKIKAHDVIVQNLKIRTGDHMEMDPNARNSNLDAIALTDNAAHVILDQLTCSWATDETVQIYGDPKYVTLQRCIIAEGIAWGKHPYTKTRKQAHGCAIIIGSGKEKICGNITIFQNLMAHNCRRNPLLSCQLSVDVVNNVMYNTGGDDQGIYQPVIVSSRGDQTPHYSFTGNVFIPGNDTGSPAHFVGTYSDTSLKPGSVVYFANNQIPNSVRAESELVKPHVVETPLRSLPIANEVSPKRALEQVLSEAGACRMLLANGSSVLRRDALDQRWVDDVRNGTGRWVNQGGVIPEHTLGQVNQDSDGDGLPDVYEKMYSFLDPENPKDGNGDENQDGFTNLEAFLFGLSP